jgi:hypothetical protein
MEAVAAMTNSTSDSFTPVHRALLLLRWCLGGGILLLLGGMLGGLLGGSRSKLPNSRLAIILSPRHYHSVNYRCSAIHAGDSGTDGTAPTNAD